MSAKSWVMSREQVADAIRRVKAGESRQSVADRYGVSVFAISYHARNAGIRRQVTCTTCGGAHSFRRCERQDKPIVVVGRCPRCLMAEPHVCILVEHHLRSGQPAGGEPL